MQVGILKNILFPNKEAGVLEITLVYLEGKVSIPTVRHLWGGDFNTASVPGDCLSPVLLF